jgi:DNA-binding MarR family transcriptional regulator
MLHDPTYNQLVPLIKRVHLAIRRAYDDAFAAHKLTGPQANVLRFVWLRDGIEQRELQELVGVTGATLTGIIDGLVERELVERRLSPEDARVKQLFLTGRGRAVSDELSGIMVRLHAQLVSGFSPAEQALLGDWLQRMAANMDVLAGDSCS